MRHKLMHLLFGLGLLVISVIGCDQAVQPAAESDDSLNEETVRLEAAACRLPGPQAPSDLVTVTAGERSLVLWPYTAGDYSGVGHDPINLIFLGNADPRDIRAALLALDGDRTAFGFPAASPFNNRWDDAIGDVQVSFGQPGGWTAGCIQLECGDHLQTRFHLRLFKVGNATIANCHYEVLIPGTSTHQVLSWELAEQFVKVDILRSGLIDGPATIITSDEINPAPSFGTIPAVVYDGLPLELRMLIGGPVGDVVEDVPIASDGRATILDLVRRTQRIAETRTQDFFINFGQVVPKPFCASGPYDYVYVEGPVHLRQTSRLIANGRYETDFSAFGELSVTPVDPMTGNPAGETLTAKVWEKHNSLFCGWKAQASSLLLQRILPESAPGAGQLFTMLKYDSHGLDLYYSNTCCHDSEVESNAKPLATLLTGGALQ